MWFCIRAPWPQKVVAKIPFRSTVARMLDHEAGCVSCGLVGGSVAQCRWCRRHFCGSNMPGDVCATCHLDWQAEDLQAEQDNLVLLLVRPIARGWTTPSVTTSRRSRSTISATGRERRRSRRGKFTRAHTPAHTPACGPGILEARRAGGGRSLCTNRRTSRLARWIARGVRMPQSSTTDSARAAPRRYQTVLTPLPANDNTAARQ